MCMSVSDVFVCGVMCITCPLSARACIYIYTCICALQDLQCKLQSCDYDWCLCACGVCVHYGMCVHVRWYNVNHVFVHVSG